jgi:hypothetical protein
MKLFLAFMLPTALLVTGCKLHSASPTSTTFDYAYTVPSAPPKGSVSIAVQKVQVDAHTVHWKWIVRGDRAWTSTLLTGSQIILGQSSPVDHQLPYTGRQFNNIGKARLRNKHQEVYRLVGWTSQ